MKKVLFTSVLDSFMILFNLPLLKYFKEQGYEVHVATSGDDEIPYCDKKFKISLERSPFKVNNLKAIKQLKRIIDSEHYDIIHTHTPMGSAVTRLAAKHARKTGTRVIYTAHGFHFFTGAPLKNWLIYYTVEKWLAKYTDTIITINKEDYDRARKKFSKRCKDIEYVPGIGIDTNKFCYKIDNSIRKELGLSNDCFIISCIARMDKNKNQSFLINVMKLLKNQNIYLLLVGPDELNGYYQKLVSKLGLDNKVLFLGFRKDINKILNGTDVVVSSSLREGLPVNILEAFSCGKPVVALGCRGAKDLITNGENGYVIDINDKNKELIFSNCIEKIKSNKDLYDNMSKNNLRKVKNYEIEQILPVMQKIYNKYQ